MKSIFLASQSPRRKQLLELAEIPFSVISIQADECYPEDLNPIEVPLFIATNKMKIGWKQTEDKQCILIAADTIVLLENEIIGKPENAEQAIRILTKLSGKCHQVITGVVIKSESCTIYIQEITKVFFLNYLLIKSLIM